jgi:hypothetical protein
MKLDGNTEENNTMKVSLIALTFGFFLVVGLPLAATAGPTPGGPDYDGDTVEDAFDNCCAVANPDQADTDHDACGNACELRCDENNDGKTDTTDFIQMSYQWGAGPAGAGTCDGSKWPFPNTSDCNDDGCVDTSDFIILSAEWFPKQLPGPSGITNASRNYDTCPLHSPPHPSGCE